jgi:hypothetical protein
MNPTKFIKPKCFSKGAFRVGHYAGDVEYDVDQEQKIPPRRSPTLFEDEVSDVSKRGKRVNFITSSHSMQETNLSIVLFGHMFV